MKRVEMRLNHLPFTQIKSGKKTVEVRLFDEKRRDLEVGDEICFRENGGEGELSVKIVALHRFDTFRQLFESGHYEKCGFSGYTVEEAVECMRQYYSEQEEKACGVLGIEIELQ